MVCVMADFNKLKPIDYIVGWVGIFEGDTEPTVYPSVEGGEES